MGDPVGLLHRGSHRLCRAHASHAPELDRASATALALACLYVVAGPTVIEPLFNTYTPLPDSSIKRDILALARASGVPADDIYSGDASRQTRILNAHVSGLGGAARISIDDNTLADRYTPGILFCHEIGHYVLGHVLHGVALTCLVATIGFAVVGWAGPRLV